MCGIFGGHVPLLEGHAEQLLAHRGPDQRGRVVCVDRRGLDFVLGMTRLNIVDRRDMPVPFGARDSYVCFNGEIYNWREIRERLEKKGILFETQTDTEMVLHAYLEWGPSCLELFNGMFAIAIWRDGELFLARDRLGKKPLYYCLDVDGLAFGSEMKVFKRLEFGEVEICEKLEFYFDEFAPFRNVKSLKPGEYLIFDSASREIQSTIWWRYPEYQGTISNLKVALDEFIPLFEDACRIRRQADVPVTIFLSGGVDSSLIQAVLKFPTTYTVQFPEFKENVNEEDLVQEYADFLKFDARVIKPTREDFWNCFSELARFIEFPVGSFSLFPLYCLARQTRMDGFKVALSGEGADELFNGYYRNELLLSEDEVISGHLNGPYRHLAGRYFGSHVERVSRMASRNGLVDVEILVDLFRPLWTESAPFVHNLSKIETSIFLQPLLVMADRMSMANGMEVRSPFMDYRLVEFSSRLVPELRYLEGRGKVILREALKALLGVDHLGIIRRKFKHGLPAPVNTWLFRQNNFDRREWNRVMIGECLRQMSLR